MIVTFGLRAIPNIAAGCTVPLYKILFNADSFLNSNRDVSLFQALVSKCAAVSSLLNLTRRKEALLLYSRRIMGSRLSLLVPSLLLLLLPSLVL